MLSKLLDDAKARRSAAFEAGFNTWRSVKALSDATMEKEKDYSIPAGLASGIGGVTAGMAVAGDIASQNADIRKRNEARKEAFAAQEDLLLKASADRNKDIFASVDILERQLEATKLKLTDENIPKKELMDSIKVQKLSVTATEGGLIAVSAEVCPTKEWKIADEVSGRIDGTIEAKIYQNDKEVGHAYLTLPLFGLPYDEPTMLKGICTKEYTAGTYRAELEGAALWVIEK